MAKAPKVKPGGYEAAKERTAKAQQVYRVTVADTGVTYTYAPYNVPIRVRALVRDLFGMSLDQFLFARGAVDVQTYADLWWIARLSDGEHITRDDVHAEWDERCGGIDKDGITDELIAGTDDDGDEPTAPEPDDPKA